VRAVAVAAGLAWVLPIAVSAWKPVFYASRTPVMLLPVTAVLLGVLLERLASRAALVALAALLLLAAAAGVSRAARQDPLPTRASVQALLRGARCGDTIVSLGISSDPVEYYLRRLRAPSCVQFEKFPRAMENWTGRVGQPAEMERLRQECRRLLEALAGRAGTVWVIAPTRGLGSEASAMFTEEAAARFACDPPRAFRGTGFDTLFVCTPAARPER
jgi:hypothetical protein